MTAEPLEIYLEEGDLERGLRDDVRAGLSAERKWLPPKWFYDARGSELFEEITRLPEYYPTRAERAVLAAHAPDIAALTGAKTLIELGSGSSEKTRLLLDAFTRRGGLGTFVPLDVSVSALRGSTAQIAADYPAPAGAGHRGGLHPATGPAAAPAVGGWWCSSAARSATCCRPSGPSSSTAMRAALEVGDWLLLGTDLVKDPSVIVPAYDDAAGVTAEFNRNVLRRDQSGVGRRLRPGRVRARRASGIPSRSGSRCGCGRAADARAGART